jgi:Flp pilus assembly protein TadG
MNTVSRGVGRAGIVANRRGAAAVEFALTGSILFLFLFAALEFSRYNMIAQTATNAAFEAARTCVVPGASAASGQTAGANILNAVGIAGGTVTMSPATITNTTTQVSATVTVSLASNLWISPVFCGSGTITKTCTLTCDWVDSAR